MIRDKQQGRRYSRFVNSPTYIGRTKKTNGLEEVNRYFEAVAEEYGAEYLNYENWELNEDASNFAATVHLNEKGTHLFSFQFAEAVQLKKGRKETFTCPYNH